MPDLSPPFLQNYCIILAWLTPSVDSLSLICASPFMLLLQENKRYLETKRSKMGHFLAQN